MLKDFPAGMGPKPAAPASSPTSKPNWMSDAEWQGMVNAMRVNEVMRTQNQMLGGQSRAPSPAPKAESPYDIVGAYAAPGVHYMGRPRWEVDRDRQKAELELENQRLQMEYQRWMIEQKKRNPYGMDIRDLLYGKQ